MQEYFFDEFWRKLYLDYLVLESTRQKLPISQNLETESNYIEPNLPTIYFLFQIP